MVYSQICYMLCESFQIHVVLLLSSLPMEKRFSFILLCWQVERFWYYYVVSLIDIVWFFYQGIIWIVFICSSSRSMISKIISVLLRQSISHISPDPSLHSGFSMILMQWMNIFSCSCPVVGAVILNKFDIKDVSKCWIVVVHAETL